MTRNHVLASVLYRSALSLKTMDINILNKKKNRENVISTLSFMQFLTHCVGMKHITDEQAETILSVSKNAYAYDVSDISEFLREASSGTDFSAQYDELLFYMHVILSSCIKEMNGHRKGYKENVRRYILGFHNLPRAFLSPDDRWMISPNEARNYSESYVNSD